MSKFFTGLLIVLSLLFGAFYVFVSSSYQSSLRARFYYALSDYEQSLYYAKKANEEDMYNKMAFSLITKSQIALNYQAYINRCQSYLSKIEQISSKRVVSDADKAKIKLMCDIALEEYETLKSSIFVPSELDKKAKSSYKKFVKIKNKLF